jgi:hypothetical protein
VHLRIICAPKRTCSAPAHQNADAQMHKVWFPPQDCASVHVYIHQSIRAIKMTDLLMPMNWWETSAFGSPALPFCFSSPQDSYSNDGWEDLDGDLELFLAIEQLLTGERKSYWEHERLDWDRHVQKLLHEDRFHIRYHMPLEDFEALVELLGDGIVPNVV